MDWMSVLHPQPYLEALQPDVTAFRSEALWGWGCTEVRRVGPLWWDSWPSKNWWGRRVLSPMRGQKREGGRPQARKRALTQNQSYSHFWPPELWEINVCCLSTQAVVSVTAAWTDRDSCLMMSSSPYSCFSITNFFQKKMSTMAWFTYMNQKREINHSMFKCREAAGCRIWNCSQHLQVFR